MKIQLADSFIQALPADVEHRNNPRQVVHAAYSFVTPVIPSQPEFIHISEELAEECGIDAASIRSPFGLNILSGAEVYPGTKPYAMCYGGHQFGHWAGQLGDGRAINLFEHLHNGQRFTFQLKGAGPTPYSRKADGLAVLRSSVREFLCSEAMFHLGVPTTRALSIVNTGDLVWRDVLYNGNPAQEKGAIVCRVAPSFIRFGNFEIFASRQDFQNLKLLADYTIQYFYPHLHPLESGKYLAFFQEVCSKTLDLMLHWQRVGFVHGVMNTDNMSILGLTIDYGPYGWLEDYNPDWTPNTTDAQGKRYRYGHQPEIAFWNLIQLANALYPLIEDVKALEEVLTHYQSQWSIAYPRMLANKLGFKKTTATVNALTSELENLLTKVETDYIIFYRQLAQISRGMAVSEIFDLISMAFYDLAGMPEDVKREWINWLTNYTHCISEFEDSDAERRDFLNSINPKYVLRNYMAQMAIDEAEKGDYRLLKEIYELLKNPYDEQPKNEKWYAKRPEWARNKVGSSMLSCSS